MAGLELELEESKRETGIRAAELASILTLRRALEAELLEARETAAKRARAGAARAAKLEEDGRKLRQRLEQVAQTEGGRAAQLDAERKAALDDARAAHRGAVEGGSPPARRWRRSSTSCARSTRRSAKSRRPGSASSSARSSRCAASTRRSPAEREGELETLRGQLEAARGELESARADVARDGAGAGRGRGGEDRARPAVRRARQRDSPRSATRRRPASPSCRRSAIGSTRACGASRPRPARSPICRRRSTPCSPSWRTRKRSVVALRTGSESIERELEEARASLGKEKDEAASRLATPGGAAERSRAPGAGGARAPPDARATDGVVARRSGRARGGARGGRRAAARARHARGQCHGSARRRRACARSATG